MSIPQSAAVRSVSGGKAASYCARVTSQLLERTLHRRLPDIGQRWLAAGPQHLLRRARIEETQDPLVIT